MATLGRYFIGSSTRSMPWVGDNTIFDATDIFTLPAEGHITKLSFFGASSSGSVSVKGLIYSGYPDIPSICEEIGTEVSVSTPNWYDSTMDVVLPAGVYYMGLVVATSDPYLNFYYNSPGVGVENCLLGTSTYSDPDDYSDTGGVGPYLFSMHVTYIPSPDTTIQKISTIQNIQSVQF